MAQSLNEQALTDLRRVKRHLGLSTEEHDAELVAIINEVSAFIATQCRRYFRSASYVCDGSTLPRLRAKSPTLLVLENPPVTAVASLVTYNGGTTLTEGTGSGDGDFVVDEGAGTVELINGAVFTYWRQPSIEITYTGGFLADGASTASKVKQWGWTTRAADVGLAATRAAAWQWRQKDKNIEQVVSISSGGTTVTLRDSEIEFVEKVIAAYRVISPW